MNVILSPTQTKATNPESRFSKNPKSQANPVRISTYTNFGLDKSLRPTCKTINRTVLRMVNGRKSKRISIEIPILKEDKSN